MKVKNKSAFLFLGFLLVACDPGGNHGEELSCAQPASTISLEVVLLETPDDVEQVYRELAEERGIRVDKEASRDAFCILRSTYKTCYLPRLRGQRDDELMQLWGHEFAHVVCGDWHEPDFDWRG